MKASSFKAKGTYNKSRLKTEPSTDMVLQQRGHPVLPPLHTTTDKNTTPTPTTTTRKISGVLALESQNLARSSVVTKWMGDRYVVGLTCTRPEISAESNSMQTLQVLRMRLYTDVSHVCAWRKIP